MNLRLPIVIGMYAFIVVFLPQNAAVDRMFDKIRTIDPDIAIAVSTVALAIAVAVLWFMWRKPKGVMHVRPTRVLAVVHYGLVGVAFSGAFALMQRLSGQATDLVYMILVPVAFMISEGIYLAIEWRLNRNFDTE